MNLVTDRTKADVLLGTKKGQYGVEDLNRVEQAVAMLAALTKSLGICYEPVVKTDWSLPGSFSAAEWPTRQQMMRYLGNVRSLCDKLEIETDIPHTMEALTWDGANRIEQALLLAYARIQDVLQIFRYSGEFCAGEENQT